LRPTERDPRRAGRGELGEHGPKLRRRKPALAGLVRGAESLGHDLLEVALPLPATLRETEREADDDEVLRYRVRANTLRASRVDRRVDVPRLKSGEVTRENTFLDEASDLLRAREVELRCRRGHLAFADARVVLDPQVVEGVLEGGAFQRRPIRIRGSSLEASADFLGGCLVGAAGGLALVVLLRLVPVTALVDLAAGAPIDPH
jgi:hypothetical protein